MPHSLKVLVEMEALEQLPASGKRRAAVLSFIRGLAEYSQAEGDFVMTDPETGRPFQVSAIAGYAITWWIDGPVDEVKVVDIRAMA